MGFEPTTFCLASRQAYIIEQKLMPTQPSQPLLRILNLSYTRISVFPEVKEFLVMLYGFLFYTFWLFILQRLRNPFAKIFGGFLIEDSRADHDSCYEFSSSKRLNLGCSRKESHLGLIWSKGADKF